MYPLVGLPLIDMWPLWVVIPLLTLLGYTYAGFSCAKYYYYRELLDFRDPEPVNEEGKSKGEIPFTFFLWPLLVLTDDPDRLRGIVLPTLWLWPRFRREYPDIKAERSHDVEFQRGLSRKRWQRQRELARIKAQRADVGAEVAHEADVTHIRKDIDKLHEASIEGPPVPDETLQLARGTDPHHTKRIREAQALQNNPWCNYHQGDLMSHHTITEKCDADVIAAFTRRAMMLDEPEPQ